MMFVDYGTPLVRIKPSWGVWDKVALYRRRGDKLKPPSLSGIKSKSRTALYSSIVFKEDKIKIMDSLWLVLGHIVVMYDMDRYYTYV